MARIDDGHSTRVNFVGVLDGGISFWEKEVTPPGIDGGGPNDTTTMRNTTWRTKSPKKLKTLETMRCKVAYDPVFYSTIVASLVNVNTVIAVTFPNGAVLTFWGWMDKFMPDPAKEGEQPTAEMVVECSNQDNNGVEQPPIYVAP